MNWNEVWIVFEVSDDFTFTTVFREEEKAILHVDFRQRTIIGTEMEGRTIYYKKYVVLE